LQPAADSTEHVLSGCLIACFETVRRTSGPTPAVSEAPQHRGGSVCLQRRGIFGFPLTMLAMALCLCHGEPLSDGLISALLFHFLRQA
jgi:hypothetical protein